MRILTTTVLFVLLCLGFLLVSCGKSVEPTPSSDPMVPYHGDINVNGVSYEIADAVMFTNYFIVGTDAFGSHVDSSVAATEVNNNGIKLELADFVYLVRNIVGDYLPHPALPPSASCEILFSRSRPDMNFYTCTENIGAIRLTFAVNGTVTTPTTSSGMDITYGINNDTLKVLIYNIGTECMGAASFQKYLDLNFNGTVELIDVEVSSYEGVTIPVTFRPY